MAPNFATPSQSRLEEFVFSLQADLSSIVAYFDTTKSIAMVWSVALLLGSAAMLPGPDASQ